MNLKTEFPYSTVNMETDKPPDISNIGQNKNNKNNNDNPKHYNLIMIKII